MQENKKLILIFALLIISTIAVGGVSILQKNRVEQAERIRQAYKLGEIRVDPKKRIIWFDAFVKENEDRAQFLVYTEGYKWLEEESALVSQARLRDLQEALALLDWRVWDQLWNKEITPETKKYSMDLVWMQEGQIKRVKAIDCVQVSDEDKPLLLWDFVFLGSPYFDQIALFTSPSVPCRACPVFPLEERALREGFVRKSGESGYALKPGILPEKGRQVRVEIMISP